MLKSMYRNKNCGLGHAGIKTVLIYKLQCLSKDTEINFYYLVHAGIKTAYNNNN